MIDNFFGAISNISVNNNLLSGGDFTVYDDAHFNSNPITGVSFTNNHLGSGQFGTTDFNGTNPTFTGNVNDAATLIATLNTAANNGGGTSTPSAPPTPTPSPTPAAPNAPVISSTGVTGGITNHNTLTLTGTAVANSTVTVLDGTTKIGTATVNSSGAWNFTTATLADGKHSFTATDASSGQTSVASSAASVTVDTHAPAAPVLVSDSVVNTNHLQVSGTAEASSTVTVFDGTTAVGTATASTSGAWSVTTGALATGAHVLTATATDAAGNTSAHSQALDPMIGSVVGSPPPAAPPPVVALPAAPTMAIFSQTGTAVGSTTTADDLLLKGTAEVNSTVSVYDGTKQIGTAATNSSGLWSFDTGHLADGSHSFSATVTDAAGNLSMASAVDHVTVDAPVSTPAPAPAPTPAPAVAITHLYENTSDMVTIKGTADAFSEVKINDGTKSVGMVKTDADGTWSYTSSAPVSNTVHTYTAQELDSTGHVVASSTGSAILGSSTGGTTLTSTAGNDIFVDPGHSDTFVFAPNFGQDTVSGFKASGPSHDVIQFSKSVFDSFADVLAHATQSGHNVVIADAAGDTLTLKNVKLGALEKHDFHFA